MSDYFISSNTKSCYFLKAWHCYIIQIDSTTEVHTIGEEEKIKIKLKPGKIDVLLFGFMTISIVFIQGVSN